MCEDGRKALCVCIGSSRKDQTGVGRVLGNGGGELDWAQVLGGKERIKDFKGGVGF